MTETTADSLRVKSLQLIRTSQRFWYLAQCVWGLKACYAGFVQNYWRFGKACLSHPQGTRRIFRRLLDPWKWYP